MIKSSLCRIYTPIGNNEIPTSSKQNIHRADKKLVATAQLKAERCRRALRRGTRKIPYSWSQIYTALEWRNMQMQDKNIGVVLKWKETGTRPSGPEVCSASSESRHYWNYWSTLEIHDGLLFKRFVRNDQTDSYLQLIVPVAARAEIMQNLHSSLLSGHLGRKKTTQKILRNFYWFQL